MSEPVQKGAGEPLGAKDFRPFLEGQARGQHEAVRSGLTAEATAEAALRSL